MPLGGGGLTSVDPWSHVLDGGRDAPTRTAIFGLSGSFKRIGSLCCGVPCKRNLWVPNNGPMCDVSFRQNSLTTWYYWHVVAYGLTDCLQLVPNTKKVKTSHTHHRAADPCVQAVSPQVTTSHPPGGWLPLLSARPAVTFPVAAHHCLLAGTKLYCLVTEAHRCEQLAQGCYAASPWVLFEPTTYRSQVQRSTRCTT